MQIQNFKNYNLLKYTSSSTRLHDVILLIPCITDLPGERVLICEGFTKNIRCQDDQHLYIHRAFYGRSNSVTCSDSRAQQISCSMPDVFVAISHWCNGERECTLAASNRTFGDPCPQTSKYLSLQYSCQGNYFIRLAFI